MNILDRLIFDAAKPDALEMTHQKCVMAWAAVNRDIYPHLKWFHAIPNANSQRQVAEGVRAGVSDLFLPVAIQVRDSHGFPEAFRYGYHGLYIELKLPKRRTQKDGGLSQDQIDFLKYANEVGYRGVVCYGWLEAKDELVKYLNGE